MKKTKNIVFGLFCATAVFCLLCIGHAALAMEKQHYAEDHWAMTGAIILGVIAVMLLSVYIALQKVENLAPDAAERENAQSALRDGISGCVICGVLSIIFFLVTIFFVAHVFVMLAFITFAWSGCFGFVWYHARKY